MRTEGLEPSTYGLKGRAGDKSTHENKAVSSGEPSACQSLVQTPANANASADKSLIDALTMLARLPLSDVERAEAVRRLLGDTRTGS